MQPEGANDNDDDDLFLQIADDAFDPNSLLNRFGHLFTQEDLKHCTFYEDLRYFEFFVDQRSALWHGLRSKITNTDPSSVRRMTGSILSTIVGLSRKTSMPYDMWRAWTDQLRPNESSTVVTTVEMMYGTVYENRIRCILMALLAMPIREPGFYVDADRPWFGVSPDGITKELTMVASFHGGMPQCINMGRTIIEIKASLRLLRVVPQIEHLVQMHEEMFIPRCEWGWLIYWHCDAVRVWLVQYSDSFWQWIMRRAEGFLDACRKRCELTDELKASMGFEIQDEWFGEEEARLTGRKYYPKPRSEASKAIAPSPPEKPNCWMIFEHVTVGDRDPEREEDKEFEGRKLYPRMRPEGDPWYTNAWKPIWDEAAAAAAAAAAPPQRVPDAKIYNIRETHRSAP
jgi:hypothetical protein